MPAPAHSVITHNVDHGRSVSSIFLLDAGCNAAEFALQFASRDS